MFALLAKAAAPLLSKGSRRILLILLLFFVSGACGLLYQVVWARKLVLLFGTTAYAVSTVLSIFFLGLGFGSLYGGRLADRTPRPLLLYGVFEMVIGLWALFFIVAIGRGESAVVWVLRAGAFSRHAGIALRALLALGFLLVPVLLMGATLPLLAKAVSTDPRVRGLRIGALYSLNTFGAVAGCALAGFMILPRLGYTRSTLVGAAGNCAVGLLAMAYAHRRAVPQPASPPLTDHASGEPFAVRFANALVLVCFGVSGFCALALEVLWTRLLTLVFLGTTYAFTTMLTTLLCGLAVGSACAAALVDRRRHPVSLFGCIEMLIGAAALLMLSLFVGLPKRLLDMQVQAGFDWERIVQAKFLLSFLVLFAPTFLFGMTFPIVVKALTAGHARLGRDVGRLYSVNTFGGVAGALAGGYVLIPMLGTHQSIEFLSWLLFGAGAALVLACPTRGRAPKLAALVAGLALMALAERRAPADVGFALNDGYVPKSHRVLDYREGVEGTVVIAEPQDNPTGSNRTLFINAVQATVSIEKGVKMNRFQGVLPLLFNRDPRRVLFMCFGSGITAGTLGLYDFERIDAVEIAPDVLDVASFFAADNFDVLENPRIRTIVDDGRNFLLTTKDRYDVITFEPMPLALAGVSTFYTREYYALCLEHLTPGGLVSQWVPLHSLDPGIVRSLVHTFTRVFPEYCVWFVNADLFLIGSDQPLRIDWPRLRERLTRPRIERALRETGFGDLVEVVSCFLMGKENTDRYVQGGAVMVDDRPWAEFVAPKLMYETRKAVPKALAELAPLCESPSALVDTGGLSDAEARTLLERIDRRHQAKLKDLEGLEVYYSGTFGAEPEAHFKEALAIDQDDYNARYYLREITTARVQRFLDWEEEEKALACLEDALKYVPDEPELHRLAADVLYEREEIEQARRHYDRYAALGGTDPRALDRRRELAHRRPAP